MKIIGRQQKSHFSRKEKVFGQFFTPKEVADFMLDFILVNQNKRNKAIDPACGEGVFLKGLIERGFKEIIGIDTDKEIINSIPEDVKNKTIILHKDGLLNKTENNFDVVVGNPPFSAKYGRVRDKSILEAYKVGQGKKTQAIEILFLERFIRLASPKGVIGIILPSGIFSNLPLRYIRKFLLENTSTRGILSLPRGIFNGGKNTTSKTYILFAEKGKKTQKVFMGIANSLSDLPMILDSYQKGVSSKKPSALWVTPDLDALYPEFYTGDQIFWKTNQNMKRLKDIISEMFCGKTEYAHERIFSKQGIPFISAKTITKLGVDFSRDRRYIDYKSKMYKKKAHVQIGDLLFVRVGVGCIGRASVVTDPSECGVADDYIYIIRTKDKELVYYLAFYLQSKYGVFQINKMKRGVGTVTIPQTLLKNLLIPVLSISLEEKVKKLYMNMVKERKKNRDEAQRIYKEAIKCIEKEVEKVI